MSYIKQPIYRSKLRRKCGIFYYGILRKFLWIKYRKVFASNRQKELLPYTYFTHKTVLRRELKDVDMCLQTNKIKNLEIAVKQLNTIIIRPGEIFSYWKIIGKPTKRKGYVNGLILQNGKLMSGIGGGLCQLSNLIFWMSLHTPLTIVERYRHGFDVFPDSNRTQPFGSGATCFYPHRDLIIKNNTSDTYQLIVSVGPKYLTGEWKVSSAPAYKYEIIEKNHKIQSEYWGGYTRRNELFQQKFDINGLLLSELMVVKNVAIMMYSPFLETKTLSRD